MFIFGATFYFISFHFHSRYVARCTPEQGTVYFLCAPNRALAEASPYYETFKAHNREVSKGAWVLECVLLSCA